MARTMQSAAAPSTQGSAPRKGSIRAPQALQRSDASLSLHSSKSARKQSIRAAEMGDATSEGSSSEEDHLVGSTSAAAKQNSVPPSSRVTRQSSRSGSELAGDEGQASRKEKNRSTAQRNERQVDEEDNDNDDDDDDETPPPPPQSAKRASTRIASQPQQPRASTSRTKSFAGKSLPGASKTKQVLKTLKTEAAKRRKKTGFVSSRRSGAASGEDGENVQDSPDEGLATVVENDDDDDSDRDGDLNNIPRTRSLSIAGYQWKAQDVTIKAQQVIKCLKYCRARRFTIRVDKRRALRETSQAQYFSSLSEASEIDEDDPNYTQKTIVYKRGQLVYFLPDPEWLDLADDGESMAVDDLDPEDWWLGLVLDCAELKYKTGETASVLRVAWCYSPEQAKELFQNFPTSSYTKQLQTHRWLPNEMVASDHIDFVGAESTGGPYLTYEALKRRNKRIDMPKTEDVSFRFMIRGLEQSDLERSMPPAAATKRASRKMWLEPMHQRNLTETRETWATVLSHEARQDRFAIPTEVVRCTTALQDHGTVRKQKAKQIQSYRGRGKGRGKGKSAFHVNSSKPGGAGKRPRSSLAPR